MTDNNQWQSPAGAPTPPPTPYGAPTPPPPAEGFAPPTSPAAEGFAPPAPSGYAPPSFGYTSPPTANAQPAWTPPPKPGLIPLRPLGFGTLLGASFQVLRRNPKPTLGMGLLLNGGVGLLLAVTFGGFFFYLFSRVQSATIPDTEDIVAGSVGLGVIALLIPVALSLIVSAILQGVVSLEVARATIGEKLRFRGLWQLAKGRIGALIGWSVLISGAALVVVVVFALIVTLIGVTGGTAGIAAAVVLGIFLGLGGFVVTVWIGIKLSLVPSVLMLERLSLRAAIARSWSLTGGYFWKTLGILLLVNVIVSVATQIISTPLSIVAGIGGSLINPNGESTAGIAIAAISYLLSGVVSVVLGAVATVLASAVATLIYIDIRMRKEGLDIELTRFVEAREAQETGVANPYEYVHPPLPGSAPIAPGSVSPWS